MSVVRVMQMTIDQVIHMVSMGNGFVAAIGAVNVGRIVSLTAMVRCAIGRIGRTDL